MNQILVKSVLDGIKDNGVDIVSLFEKYERQIFRSSESFVLIFDPLEQLILKFYDSPLDISIKFQKRILQFIKSISTNQHLKELLLKNIDL